MSTSRPDPLTELIKILREQLQQKDERIERLEMLLRQANASSASAVKPMLASQPALRLAKAAPALKADDPEPIPEVPQGREPTAKFGKDQLRLQHAMLERRKRKWGYSE